MKKLLFASTAMVAVALAGVDAKAAEPVRLSVGGYMETWAGFAQNDDPSASVDYSSFDVKKDSEVHFKGKTMLDNGIEVYVEMELETDRSSGGAMDESFLRLTGAFGRLIIGEEDAPTVDNHHPAPDVGVSHHDGDFDLWVKKPSAVGAFDTTAYKGEESSKVIYYTPSFSGFKAFASYNPTIDTEDENPVNTKTDRSNWTGGVTYDGKFDDIGIGADISFAKESVDNTTTTTAKAWQAGLNIDYAGFTVGGSYMKHEDSEGVGATTSKDGHAFTVGAAYKTGPYAVSLSWLSSEQEGTISNTAKDKQDSVMLSGAYKMGPGVSLLGSVFSVKYDDETTAQANNNDGWAAVAGIKVTF